MRCMHVTIFTGLGMERREPTDEEQARIMADPAYTPILTWIYMHHIAYKRERARWN